MTSKIPELQGLRCLAIIGVLAFHIWPNYFWNGFLGVDVFFALSGYLMAVISLPSNPKATFWSSTLNFYYRRIYRILPLYLINILVTILIVPVMIISIYFTFFLSEIKAALLFGTNISMLLEKRSYFNPYHGFQWFKHYWSLCVELQFYLLVPFLFFLCKKLPTTINLFLLWPCLIACSVATILYAIHNYGEKGAIFCFSQVPCRLAQFGGGIIAFYVQTFTDDILNYTNSKAVLYFFKGIYSSVTVNLLSLAIMGILLYPVKLSEFYFQIIIVIIASALITTCQKKFEDSNDDESKEITNYNIIGHKAFVLIGDASYALYITHWVIVTIAKAAFNDEEQNRRLLFAASLITGILVHLYIEKPILQARWKPKKFFKYVLLFYAGFAVYIFTMSTAPRVSPETKAIYFENSPIIANASEWASYAATIDPQLSMELAFHADYVKCRIYPISNYSKLIGHNSGGIIGSEFQGTGNLGVLILGNSHAECITPGILKALDGQYSTLSTLIFGGITPFEGFQYSREWFLIKPVVEHYKPDIIYLIFKYQVDFEEPPTWPVEDDLHTKKIQEMITFLSANTKVLFIGEKHFEAEGFTAVRVAERMHSNGWLPSFGFSQQRLEDQHIASTLRWKTIQCSNCIFMNLLQAYCKKGWCSPVDAVHKVPLLHDDNHVTLYGAYAMTPYIREYFQQVEKFLKVL